MFKLSLSTAELWKLRKYGEEISSELHKNLAAGGQLCTESKLEKARCIGSMWKSSTER